MTAISWKFAATIALVVIVVAAGVFVLLRRGGGGTGDGELPGDNAQAGEVLFKYEASFTYRGSENNVPLMGYLVLFPCPTVDGEPALTAENLRWQLWGPVEGENGARWLELEVDNNNVFQWVGERASSPPDNDFYLSPLTKPHDMKPDNNFIMVYGCYGFNWKVFFQNDFDNLYPGEQLRNIAYFSLPVKNENLVTLEEDNEVVRQENGEVLAAKVVGDMGLSEPIPIDLSYQVKLSKKVDNDFVMVKSYSRTRENCLTWSSGWIELYPD